MRSANRHTVARRSRFQEVFFICRFIIGNGVSDKSHIFQANSDPACKPCE